MRLLSFGFFLGTCVLLLFPRLPNDGWGVWLATLCILLVAGLLGLLPYGRKFFLLLACIFLGFAYALQCAGDHQQAQISTAWEGKDVLLEGVIRDVPELREGSVRFLLDAEQARLVGGDVPAEVAGEVVVWRGLLRVSWYLEPKQVLDLHAGERWQLVVRSKRPNGFMNPGGFDYEQWLFAQRIVATGYVRDDARNRRLQPAPPLSPDRLREAIQSAISAALPEQGSGGLIQGLAVSYRAGISPEQWEVLQATGTGHLLSISGLHIAMVAGFGFLPVMVVWWLFPALCLRLPVRVAGGMVGALFATAYALLAGFDIPVQRSLVMVLILLAGLLLRQAVPFTVSFAVAVLAVLLLDPLAPLAVGFWLSFVSVGMLFLLGSRRNQRHRFAFITLQLGLSLGIIPLNAAFFGSVSLVSPLANLFAIPWVTLLVVPLILVGIVVLPFSVEGAAGLWWLAAQALDGMFALLAWLAALPWAVLHVPALPWQWSLLAFLGFVVWLLPQGMPGRWLGLLLMLPLFVWSPPRPAPGEFRLSVLDVGQGLATVVQTAGHVLVFDAGPKAASGFDTGELVLLPWLRAKGIHAVDTLMVSHADNDHRGGAGILLADMPPANLWANAADMFPERPAQVCAAGQGWTWDGVQFRIVHPAVGFRAEGRNNHACVLHVSNGVHAALLTADIERPAEQWLVKQAEHLQADVLLAPHHGSKTSSSAEFLAAVQPRLAIVSTGYLNRFHHPHPKILERYQQHGIKVLNTVDTGALDVVFPATGVDISVSAYRQEYGRFWNR